MKHDMTSISSEQKKKGLCREHESMGDQKLESKNEVFLGQKGRAAYERQKKAAMVKGDAGDHDVGADADAADEMQNQKPSLAHLYRHHFDDVQFSAGSLQPTRLQLISATECVLASQNTIQRVEMRWDERNPDSKLGYEGHNISAPNSFHLIDRDSFLENPASGEKHTTEIQSLASTYQSSGGSQSNRLVASIDACGRSFLYKIDEASPPLDENLADAIQPKKRRMNSRVSMHRFQSPSRWHESGWAGIQFDPVNMEKLASVHSFSKQMCLYDVNTLQCQRQFSTVHFPTCLTYQNHGSSSLTSNIILAESNQVSVWDPRVLNGSECIARESPAQTILYAVSCSLDGHTIAVAGRDKIAYMYDNRTWRVKSRMRCPLKYALTSLHFSPNHADLFYVSGLDNEIMCCQFNGERKTSQLKKQELNATLPELESSSTKGTQSILQQNYRLGFRGDSRWTGVAFGSTSCQNDLFIGACEGGSIYAVAPAQNMLDVDVS